MNEIKYDRELEDEIIEMIAGIALADLNDYYSEHGESPEHGYIFYMVMRIGVLEIATFASQAKADEVVKMANEALPNKCYTLVDLEYGACDNRQQNDCEGLSEDLEYNLNGYGTDV